MSKRETLPRLSSRDYTEKEMNDDMELVLDVILGPGDVLYMPRGWIHQAETVSRPTSSLKPQLSDKHSLHLTISAMQNWCWADYLEVLMPVALESAIVSDKSTSLREGLPRNFLHYMGTMHQMDDDEDDTTLLPEGLRQAAKAKQDRAMVAKSNQDDGDEIDNEKELEETRLIAHERQRQLQQQRQFKEEAKKRIMRICKQAMSMLDDACDEIGKRFLSDRLPPALLKTEACLTKEGSNGDSSSSSSLHHDISKKIWPNSLCRIVRPGIARLVVEDGKAVLYHCLDNSRVYHGTPLSPMEFEIDDAPALEQLLTTVEPHWIMVKDLIHGDVEDKMEIAQTLFDEGILATMLVELPDRSVKTG
jgi:lysine-specific demethylase/histidyl-hydroxylase NO66